MPCYYPNKAHSTGTRKNGKSIIKFGLPTHQDQNSIELPCGQCIGCRLAHSQTWAIRVLHESTLHERNCFITLTYNEENLPENGSLDKKHFQNFMKYLRRDFGPEIRFYQCGEYTDKPNFRPHYHAIIFNHDWLDKEAFTENEGIITYTSEKLQKIWGKGFTTTAEVTFESAAYVARYTLKKITGKQKEKYYEKIDEV